MEFTRGDTYKFKFQRRDFNNKIIMTKATNIWFTVKKNYKTEDILIQKKLSDNTISFDNDGFYHIVIEPKDTSELKYKKYVCDIQVENIHGEITTVFKDTFNLLNEVTFLKNNNDTSDSAVPEDAIVSLKNDLKNYIDEMAPLKIQEILNNSEITIPNSSADKVGGIKTYLDSESKTLYMTNDGTSPVPGVSEV